MINNLFLDVKLVKKISRRRKTEMYEYIIGNAFEVVSIFLENGKR